MNPSSPSFCVMPHMGLAVQNEGDICACNMNAYSYSHNGQVARINNITVDQGWSSPTRKEIASVLDQGIRHESCKACWDLEDSGHQSARQELNKMFGHLEPLENQPRVLILKPGNTCNASCRTCRPETSSSWYQDSFRLHQLKNPDAKFKEYIQTFENVKNSFNKRSPNMWPVLNDWYENLEFIDIYGGEPWLIDGLWASLQTAIDKGVAHKVSLRIHTNGSVWNEHYMEILKQFKSVYIGLSLDSHVAKESEYIRNGLDYNTTLANTLKFVEYIEQHDNLKYYISITVSVLNIWSLPDTVREYKKFFDPKRLGFRNYVYTPEYYDIRHLPKDVKRQVIEKMRKTTTGNFVPVINFMNQVIPNCMIYWPKFCLETDKLDRIRNQSFKEVFPEWHSILEPYWNYKSAKKEWYGSCEL